MSVSFFKQPLVYSHEGGRLPKREKLFADYGGISSVDAMYAYCKWLVKRGEVFEIRHGYQSLLIKSTIDPANIKA